MTANGGSTPGWSTLDRTEAALRSRTHWNPYEVLTDAELLESLRRTGRGEPEPPDIAAKLRRAVLSGPVRPDLLEHYEAMTDAELLHEFRRELDLLLGEYTRDTPTPREE